MQPDRLNESLKLVQQELSLLKNSANLSSNFQEMLLKRLGGRVVGNLNGHTSEGGRQDDRIMFSNSFNFSSAFPAARPQLSAGMGPSSKSKDVYEEDSKKIILSAASPERKEISSSLKKANRASVLTRSAIKQLPPKPATPLPPPKVIHSPFRENKTPVLAPARLKVTPKTKSPKQPLTEQDLKIKFYLPTSNRGDLDAGARDLDFFIPKLDSISGTRTGLLRKDKESEMEKMRLESDERLARAVRKSNARTKALQEEKKRKEEKERSRYKNITSKVASTKKKLVPVDENKENIPKSTIPVQKKPLMSSTKDNTVPSRPPISTPKLSLAEAISKRVQSKSAVKATITKKPLSASNSPLPSTLVSKARTTISSKPSIIPSSASRNSLSAAQSAELVERVIEALGSKLDPFLMNVQQHLERTAAEIDAKVELKRPHSPIRVVNGPVDEEESIPKEAEMISVNEVPKPTLIKNDLDRDDVAMIMDMNEPSVLFNDEISQDDNESDAIHEAETGTIHIQNDIMSHSSIYQPISRGPDTEKDGSEMHNVLVLSEWVMEDLIHTKEMRRKWVNMYYGPNFDPAAVIASISGEIMLDMIDKICMEVGDVCGDYVDAIVQMEM